MARKKEPDKEPNHERWLVSYGDLLTLLFAVFVTLYAMSQADAKKAQQVADSFQNALGITSVGSKPACWRMNLYCLRALPPRPDPRKAFSLCLPNARVRLWPDYLYRDRYRLDGGRNGTFHASRRVRPLGVGTAPSDGDRGRHALACGTAWSCTQRQGSEGLTRAARGFGGPSGLSRPDGSRLSRLQKTQAACEEPYCRSAPCWLSDVSPRSNFNM
ncbi:flagellar motor protein MotB [Geomonas subterranea]|uniref:flagellar motor protein MotB n=1 Tax=Geomonas subterranea TaxID=2847989 RepID=UPI00384EC1FF